MEPEFWHRRWSKNEIGFHEGQPNVLLERHWPALGLAAGSTVLVPLCGKAVDMAWLAARGHKVFGVELSPIAVADFFAEHQLAPVVETRGGFDVSSAGGIEIWCGDLFELEAPHLAGVAAVYDRASLVALPPEMQTAYASKMAEIVPKAAPTLVVAFHYDQSQAAGPPFATPPARIRELYGDRFDIAEIDRRDALETSPNLKARGITWLEENVMLLRQRGAGGSA